MTAPSLTDTALGVGGRIGRNFSIVTLVPSLFLTMWVYALYASDAWQGEPDLGQLLSRLGGWTFASAAWLVLTTVLVGLFIHPLQFPTVQLLEGYWGRSAVARGAMLLRITHYRHRAWAMNRRVALHRDAINTAFERHLGDEVKKLSAAERDESLTAYLDGKPGHAVMSHVIGKDAINKAQARYPAGQRMMPTRLGNALRSAEDTAGRQYGLDAIATAPHFALIAPETHAAYLRDSREQLDLAVRLCSVSLLATVVTVPAVFADGLWLLIALVPYVLAYVAYRAAVSAADEYTTALSTIIDLDRFALYRHLGLPRPRTTAEERATNAKVVRLLRRDQNVRLRYAPNEQEEPS